DTTASLRGEIIPAAVRAAAGEGLNGPASNRSTEKPARSNCQASKRPSKPAPAIAMEALGESRLGCAELGNGVTSRAKTEGPGRQLPGLVPSAGVNLIRFYGFGRTDLSLRIAVKLLPR